MMQHDPLAYVVMFDRGDGTRSYHGSSMFDGRTALCYYTSPFDALIDMARPFAVDRKFWIVPVREFTPGVVKAAGKAAVSCLQVAWRARSGSVLVRLDGSPDGVLSMSPEMESGNTVRELPAPLLRFSDAIHERAGLYARKETVRAFGAWNGPRLHVMVSRAWRIPVVEVDHPDPDFDQFAVFDPEFQQWHSCPCPKS